MPDLAGSSGDGSTNSIDVKGDRNQAIGQNFGTAIGNVQGDRHDFVTIRPHRPTKVALRDRA
jgi:hypothetical protein